jgi:WD40 repeat protein
LTALAPPSPLFPWIVSGDISGELRLWPPPEPAVREIIATSSPIWRAMPLHNGVVVAVSDDPLLRWHTPDGAAGETPGHRPVHYHMVASRTQSRLVAFGSDRELELWSFDGAPTVQRAYGIHGSTSDVVYTPDGTELVVGDSDGLLVAWSADGRTARKLAALDEPIWYLRLLRRSAGVAIGGTHGTLWTFDQRGLLYLGHEVGLINSVAASPDDRWLVTATSEGVLRRYDLATRQVSTYRSPHPSSQFLYFSPDSSTLAVVTDKTISAIEMPHGSGSPSSALPWAWNQLDVAVGHCVFSPDSMWFAGVGEHGGIWFNRRGERRWVYLATGTARVSFGQFSDDGNRFVATEPSGRVLQVDMRAAIFR